MSATLRSRHFVSMRTPRFDVISIFPEVIAPYTDASILGRAQKQGLLKVFAHNLRDWTTDKHKTVDDTPYGGGAGMVMKVEPFDRAVAAVKKQATVLGLGIGGPKTTKVIMTAASGTPFTQADAKRLAQEEQLIFLCGRYEGIDHRVEEHIADEVFSIGPYVLTGGELPALVMIDAIARHIPGVLGASASLEEESHTETGVLEYPQYTKPEQYGEWRVPDVLVSGDHKKISQWRKEQQGRL